MDCCQGDDGHRGKPRGHSPLMMILCCLIPILVAVALFSLGISWSYLLLLICPLLHGGMMWFMLKNNRNGKREAVEND